MASQLTHGLEDHRQIELQSAVIRLHGARGGNWIQDTRQTFLLTMAIDSGGGMGVC